MRRLSPPSKRQLILIASMLMLIAAVLLSLFVLHHRHHSDPPILPAAITGQIPFVAYVPGSDWQTQAASVVYRNDILTFTANQPGTILTITEQATPSIFTDVPQYYPTLIGKLNQYDSFGSLYGTVYLTKPQELGGQQQAVLNTNGTLLFVHPSQNLSDDSWRHFFNSVQLIKPT